jgi:uncharacterized protein (DUF927 family)
MPPCGERISMKITNSTIHFQSDPKKGLRAKQGGTWVHVAPYIKLVGLAKEEGGDHFLLVIDFEVDGKVVRHFHPNRDTLNPAAIIAELVGKGYAVSRLKDQLDLLANFLSQTEPKKRLTILRRTGWWKDVYVRPDGRLIPTGKSRSLVYEPDDRRIFKASSAGTLKEWQNSIAIPAMHSSIMMFAMTAAFAALIMDYSSVESGIFHIYGHSTAGKSLTLCIGLSVGQRGTKIGMPHWDFTKTGFEEIAAAHCDRLLVIDEAGHIQTDAAVEKLRQTAFMMTAGSGRIRSKHFKGAENTTTWKTLGLSSGERPVSDLALSGGKKRIGGEEVRLIDVPATSGGQFGVFDSLPENISSAEFAARLERAADRYYGHPAEKFLDRLTSKSRDRRRNKIASYIDSFYKEAGIAAEGFERRFGSRFGLCYAAGILAIRWHILPWSRQQLFNAIEQTYRNARLSVPEYEATMNGALETVYHHLRRSKRRIDVRKLKKMDSIQRAKVVAQSAFFQTKDSSGTPIYAVLKSTLISWVGTQFPLPVFEQFMLSQGVLVTTTRGLPMKQVSVPGFNSPRPYFYCFKVSDAESGTNSRKPEHTGRERTDR